MEKFAGAPFKSFSFSGKHVVFGYATNCRCSICSVIIGKGRNDEEGVVTKVLFRDSRGKIEEIQVILCTSCYMTIEESSKKAKASRA